MNSRGWSDLYVLILVCSISDSGRRICTCAALSCTVDMSPTTTTGPPGLCNLFNSFVQIDHELKRRLFLLCKNNSSTTMKMLGIPGIATCTNIVASELVPDRVSNRTSPAGTGLTDTETAFGASLGTMVIMAILITAYLWAKLISKRRQLWHVQVELDAMRGAKSSQNDPIGRAANGAFAQASDINV